jgi:hypothetical protein
MKNYYRYITLFALLFVALSCSDDDSGRFNENPEFGWVQFPTNNTNRTIFIEDILAEQTESFSVPFRFTAPINTAPLTVNYSIENIEGVASDVLDFDESSTILANTNTGEIVFDIDLSALEANPFQGYVFDIVLTSATRGVRIGLQDGSYPTRYRVNLSAPCEVPDISGTYSFVSSNLQSGPGGGCPNGDGTASGNVTWTALGDDTYSSSDLSFGQFASCWGDSPATGPTLSMLCSTLSVSGTDQYGDQYTYTITDVNGPDLTIEWENTYGDGGTVVLTRTDGTDWPADLTTD